MYQLATRYPVMDGEPHLGMITEYELIQEPQDIIDIASAAIDYEMEHSGEYPDTVILIDSVSGEELEVIVSEYL